MACEDAIMVIIKSLMTAEEYVNPTSTHQASSHTAVGALWVHFAEVNVDAATTDFCVTECI